MLYKQTNRAADFMLYCFYLVYLLFLILLSARSVNSQNSSAVSATCSGPQTPGELLKYWFGPNSTYESFTRPGFAKWAAEKEGPEKEDEPPKDNLQFHLVYEGMTHVNEKRGEFQIVAWLRQSWNDTRLSYPTRTKGGGCFPNKVRQGFPAGEISRIWAPDITINGVGAKKTAEAYYIYPNGRVMYSSRIVATLVCPFYENMTMFPNDEHYCNMLVTAWAQDYTDFKFTLLNESNPITYLNPKVKSNGLNEWEVNLFGNVESIDQDNFSQENMIVNFGFILKRIPTYYYKFIVMPSFLFVIICWSSFFLSRSVAPARVGITTICFLANTNFVMKQVEVVQKTDENVFLLDLLMISQIFTFYGIIEFVLCNMLLRFQTRLKKARAKAASILSDFEENDSKEENGETKMRHNMYKAESTRETKRFECIKKSDLRDIGYTYRLDLLLLNEKGVMIIHDAHLEIFSRYVYPVAYIMALIMLWFRKH